MRMQAAKQMEFRPRLPVVVGNVDYQEHETRLLRLDDLLRRSGLEQAYIGKCLERWLQAGREEAEKDGSRFREPSKRDMARHERMCVQALRCNLARSLIQKPCRLFSLRLAESALLQWFCQIDRLEQVKVPGKSTLDRYDKLLPEPEVRELVDLLNRLAVGDAERLDLEAALALEAYFSDTTCVKANIHFPTDWVLLRDAVRTLIKAVKVIRDHGLKYRMPEPDGFLREINRLSIEMSQSRRRPDSARRRKAVLRKMKGLTKLVQGHAQRYAQRLQADCKRPTGDLLGARAAG